MLTPLGGDETGRLSLARAGRHERSCSGHGSRHGPPAAPSSAVAGGPRVRIHLPPAGSRQRPGCRRVLHEEGQQVEDLGFQVAFRLPTGAPLPWAPPCILQRAFPRTAGEGSGPRSKRRRLSVKAIGARRPGGRGCAPARALFTAPAHRSGCTARCAGDRMSPRRRSEAEGLCVHLGVTGYGNCAAVVLHHRRRTFWAEQGRSAPPWRRLTKTSAMPSAESLTT
jgi:hypothetical protein